MQDLPRLLARLRLMQARPQLQTFKQLSDSINQLWQLRQMVAQLAPAAAVAAETAGTSDGGLGGHKQSAAQRPGRQVSSLIYQQSYC